MPRILALDGGGVRGLSSLLILKKLMQEVQRIKGDSNLPLPCEYFDLICGTSTGGLIAIMLGRLRMVREVLNFFGANMRSPLTSVLRNTPNSRKDVFRLDNVKMGIPVGPGYCRFKEEELEKALKEVISEFTGHENTSMADPKIKASTAVLYSSLLQRAKMQVAQ